MIELIPAIDIIDGQCVRLYKGDYAQKKVYNDAPAAVAVELERQGFRRLHVVDLDGAKSHHIVNEKTLKAITDATTLKVDFGGGIKTDEDVAKAFDCGAAMVTIGSAAVTSPERLDGWIGRYGAQKIILAADVKDGKVAINGWKEKSDEDLFSFLQRYADKGIMNVMCTDISKDGTLSSPSADLYWEIKARFKGIYLIASGGVSCNDDIMELDEASIDAVVFGKAYYEGRIDIGKLRRHE